MAPNLIAPAVMAPLVALMLYRRVRRQFGRQPIRTRGMLVRVVLMIAVLGLFALTGLHDPRLAVGVLAGAAGGAMLGVVGLRLTQFHVAGNGEDAYTPNPWIGGLLTALLVGRLAWRLMVVMPAMQAAPGTVSAMQKSPLTMAVFGLLIGYYLAYYAGLLWHHRRLLRQLPAKAG